MISLENLLSGQVQYFSDPNSYSLQSCWTQLLITVIPSVSFFKDPKEPKKSKVTIESLDGHSLPLPRGIVRRGTESSITTIQSNESANEAFNRMEKTSGIKGLVIEFYDQAGMSLAPFFFSRLF